MASGGRYGLAQSVFQIGGNTRAGARAAAGRRDRACKLGRVACGWFGLAALLAIVILLQVGRWYQRTSTSAARKHAATESRGFPRRSCATRSACCWC